MWITARSVADQLQCAYVSHILIIWIQCLHFRILNVLGLFLSTKRSSWSWSYIYGSWIHEYLWNPCLSPLTLWVRIPIRRGVLDTTLCDKVCQWLTTGRWISPGTPISSTNKTGRQDITKILLKVALSTMALTLLSSNIWGSCYSIFSLICKLCRTLFGLLYFFLWPLCCLFFFDIWILIAPLVSSNSSFHNIRYIYNYPISTFIMTTFFSNLQPR